MIFEIAWFDFLVVIPPSTVLFKFPSSLMNMREKLEMVIVTGMHKNSAACQHSHSGQNLSKFVFKLYFSIFWVIVYCSVMGLRIPEKAFQIFLHWDLSNFIAPLCFLLLACAPFEVLLWEEKAFVRWSLVAFSAFS